MHIVQLAVMECHVMKRDNCWINEVKKVSDSHSDILSVYACFVHFLHYSIDWYQLHRRDMQHFGISKGITKCKTEKVFSVRQNLGTLMSLENPNSVHGFKGLVDDLTDNHS